MSKYTTEVRFICESKGGYSSSVDADKINEVLDRSWNKIFTSDVQFFDESYRPLLCKKILKHYYLREIGSETAGTWIFWMNTRLEEIMPYYNEVYKSARMDFNPLFDVDVTREHDGTNATTNVLQTEGKTEEGSQGKQTELYSDTPQGQIQQIEAMNYLTSATVTNTEQSRNMEGTSSSNSQTDGTEKYIEKVTGKQGTGTYSSMIKEYRDILLNIDMQVIEEFSDLFMLLW